MSQPPTPAWLKATEMPLEMEANQVNKIKWLRASLKSGDIDIFSLNLFFFFSEMLFQLSNYLHLQENLISELCKLEEKLQLGEQQISALDKTKF